MSEERERAFQARRLSNVKAYGACVGRAGADGKAGPHHPVSMHTPCCPLNIRKTKG